MKYLTTLLFVMALMWVGDAHARNPKGIFKIIRNPIEIEGGESSRMNVMFRHQSHQGKGIACKHCHHETSSETLYSSCRDECHATPGARERDPMSMFMAFHARETDRSCYGCHSQLAEKEPDKYPNFKGCRPCHMSPQAREAAATADARR